MATKNPQWTWFQKAEIRGAISTCREILNLPLFNGAMPQVLTSAAVTLLLINLNDLLQKLRSVNRTIVFADDIHPSGNATNVTELINNARNAACHLNSGNHTIDSSKFSFCFFIGKCPNVIAIGDLVLGSDYENDVAILFGLNRVYIARHITRALNEAEMVVIENGMLND